MLGFFLDFLDYLFLRIILHPLINQDPGLPLERSKSLVLGPFLSDMLSPFAGFPQT